MDNRREVLEKAIALLLGAKAGSFPKKVTGQSKLMEELDYSNPAFSKTELASRGIECALSYGSPHRNHSLQALFSGNLKEITESDAYKLTNSTRGITYKNFKLYADLALELNRLELTSAEITELVDTLYPLRTGKVVIGEIRTYTQDKRDFVTKAISEVSNISQEELRARLDKELAREKSYMHASIEFCEIHEIPYSSSNPIEDFYNSDRLIKGDKFALKDIQIMTFPDMASAAKALRSPVPAGIKILILNERESNENKSASWVERTGEQQTSSQTHHPER